jgi:ATPase family AAA domain-containing protein 3A/B
MDYALLSGGDIAPLGEDAVNQLHSLFRWASKSSKGLLVFIDEAEAFLCSRSQLQGDSNSESHVRNALNALLFQTGTPSRNFMMVLATNRPEDLDAAILDRIDISIKVALPGEVERMELVQLYMNLHINSVVQSPKQLNLLKYILQIQRNRAEVESECQSSNTIRYIASRTAGFSGREIAKLFISAQYAMLLSENRTLTWKLLQDILDTKLVEHRLKFSGFDSLNCYVTAESGEKTNLH